MFKQALTFISLMFLTSTFLTSTLVAQSPADGTWVFSMQSPMGAVAANVVMAVDGATLTGEFDLGNGRKWLIEGPTIEGNKIAFSITRDGASMTYVMSGNIDGGTIVGLAEAMGTTAEWSMSRSN